MPCPTSAYCGIQLNSIDLRRNIVFQSFSTRCCSVRWGYHHLDIERPRCSSSNSQQKLRPCHYAVGLALWKFQVRFTCYHVHIQCTLVEGEYSCYFFSIIYSQIVRRPYNYDDPVNPASQLDPATGKSFEYMKRKQMQSQKKIS